VFVVTKAQIEKRIHRRIDAIHPAQVVMLRGVYRSLKDGMSKAADWFESDTQGSSNGITPPPQLAESAPAMPALRNAPVSTAAVPQAAPEPIQAAPTAAPAVAPEAEPQRRQRAPRPVPVAQSEAPVAAPAEAPEPPADDETAGEVVEQEQFL